MPLAPTTAFDIAGLAYATAIAVNLTKWIITSQVSDTNPNQGNAVRMYVLLVALAIVALIDWLHGGLLTRADALADITTGFSVAVAAIASYHLLGSTPLLPSIATATPLALETITAPLAPVTPVEPAAAPAEAPAAPTP